jgi:hypothetical protein
MYDNLVNQWFYDIHLKPRLINMSRYYLPGIFSAFIFAFLLAGCSEQAQGPVQIPTTDPDATAVSATRVDDGAMADEEQIGRAHV